MEQLRIWVLYEDSMVAGTDFKPHAFVLRCLHDDLGGQLWEWEHRVGCRPMNGSSKLRAECRTLLPRVAGHAEIVAVYDHDKVHKLLKLSKAELGPRKAADILAEGCQPREKLKVVFLEDNLETVLTAIGTCSAGAIAVDDAIRKDRNARDIVFQRAAQEASRALRTAVRKSVPSFDYLIRDLTKRVGAPLPAA